MTSKERKEKQMMPANIIEIVTRYSIVVPPVKSPYPTVVKIVKTQYKINVYNLLPLPS